MPSRQSLPASGTLCVTAASKNGLPGLYRENRNVWLCSRREHPELDAMGQEETRAAAADQVFFVALVEAAARSRAGRYIWSTVAAATLVGGTPSSAATASTACRATLRSTRPSELK